MQKPTGSRQGTIYVPGQGGVTAEDKRILFIAGEGRGIIRVGKTVNVTTYEICVNRAGTSIRRSGF